MRRLVLSVTEICILAVVWSSLSIDMLVLVFLFEEGAAILVLAAILDSVMNRLVGLN